MNLIILGFLIQSIVYTYLFVILLGGFVNYMDNIVDEVDEKYSKYNKSQFVIVAKVKHIDFIIILLLHFLFAAYYYNRYLKKNSD